MTFRMATLDDAAEILDIYKPYITNTTISFECQPPTREAFRERMGGILARYPWVVAEHAGRIAGYAYAGKVFEREAYQWNVQVSVYVRPEYHHDGLGSAFYRMMLPLLEELGYQKCFAIISLPNEKSIGLHTKFGFTERTVFPRAGFKCGEWHDVMWMEKSFRELQAPITAPRSITEYPSEKLAALFAACNADSTHHHLASRQ